MVILVLKKVGVMLILWSFIRLLVVKFVFFCSLWLVVLMVVLLGFIKFFGKFSWYECVLVVYLWINIIVFLLSIGIIIIVFLFLLVICLNLWVVLFENLRFKCFILKSLFCVMILWEWMCGNGLFGLIFGMFIVIILLLYLYIIF